jgi:hypothetical protein
MQDPARQMRSIIRLLALACGLLALACVVLAAAWSDKADQAACYRDALRANETPAVADTDCA